MFGMPCKAMRRRFHGGTPAPSHSVDFEAACRCCFFKQHASFIYPIAFIFFIDTAQARSFFIVRVLAGAGVRGCR
jgi:hypothetical protein